ncbi:MAG: hypothetical protein QOK06_1042 [Acidimicrobiaceae bacterium]
MTRRTPRSTAWLLSLTLLALSVGLLGATGPAGASDLSATRTKTGWWWQAQAGLPVAAPPPPNVHAGQLYIQSAPSDSRGAAFAAVRYTLAPNRTVQALTLKTANDPGIPAALLACRTGSAWSAAEAGAWSAAPKVDTSACVNGQKAVDGQSWVFPAGTLQLDTVLDIAIVPGLDATTKTPTPFAITFAEPTNDAVTTIEVTPPSISPSRPTDSATLGAAPSAHPSPPPVAAALPADKIGQTATAPVNQAATQPSANPTPVAAAGSTRDKRLGYLLLLLAATVGLYAWRQDETMASHRGALAGAGREPRGLGRFQRVRNEEPPTLT